jgi:hypothetical protein
MLLLILLECLKRALGGATNVQNKWRRFQLGPKGDTPGHNLSHFIINSM